MTRVGGSTGRLRALGGLGALVAAMAIAAPAQAVSPPTITYPTEGDMVDTGALTVRGTLGSADDSRVSVMYAVDVSGSTGSGRYDCDRSGAIDAGDDLNNDGTRGDTLDCEIAGVIALNTSLAAIPGSEDRIRVGMVPFGSSAAIADVGGQSGFQSFTSPMADEDENSRDRTADIVQVASSLDQGRVQLFASRFVGTGTSFTPALTEAFDALDDSSGRKIVFLLTDGFASVSQSVLDRMQALGIEVRPFAIGSGSDRCRSGGSLDRIGDASGDPCRYVTDPTSLSAALTGGPEDVERVEVSVDGGTPRTATIDPLGNFSETFSIGSGSHTARAVAFGTDGSVAVDTVRFTASVGLKFVALGDSYSAGEGIKPYADVPGDAGGCHQSETGYATFVGEEDYELPVDQAVDLDYVACSGAVLKNLTSVRQDARGEDHIVQMDRVGPDADLVAFTVGGNDVSFSEVVAHCATQFDCWEDGFATLNSGRSLSLDEWLTLRLNLFRPELNALYRSLRDRTQDQASIVAMNYPELFDDGTLLRIGCWEGRDEIFERDERIYLNEKAVDLRGAIDDAARNQGIWFADVIEEFKGNRVCEGVFNTQPEWLTGIDLRNADLSKKQVGDASFHPDQDGAKAYARVLTEFLRARADEGAPLTAAGLPRNPGAATARSASVARAASTAGEPRQAAAAPELTPEEIEEVRRMEVGPAELEGLAARRGIDVCGNRAVPGEQLLLSGHGFAPGTTVAVSVKAASEAERRRYPGTVTVGDDGFARTSAVLPFDVQPSSGMTGEDPWTVVRFELEGTSPEGGQRRLVDVIAVDGPGSDCAVAIAAAGDVAAPDGGPASSAGSTPRMPESFLTLGPAGPTIDIVPGSAANEVDPQSNQMFWVALRSSPGFDATAWKHAKLRFGRTGTEQTPMGSRDTDVDGDGDTDQLLRFMARQTAIACGDTIATLTGERGDDRLRASDRVTPVRCEG